MLYCILQGALLALGFVLLIKGADFFVEGASGVARRFGIPQLIIGLTIVAMGTSAPEAAVSITAAIQGNGEVAVGNIVGSNILNILIILGVSSMIAPLAVSPSTLWCEIPFMILITVLLTALGRADGVVSLGEGFLLLLLFLLYLAYLLWMAGRAKKRETRGSGEAGTGEGKEGLRAGRLIALTAAGLILVIAGANLSVDAAVFLAEKIGISHRVIALTIVAFGTSLPELCTSVAAAKKGNADIAIGNIVGSNIFNILFIIGTAAVITPVTYGAEFFIDGIIAAAAGALLFICAAPKRRLVLWHGVIMLSGFAGYLWYLLV